MRKILLIAAAIVSLSGGARADIMDQDFGGAQPQARVKCTAVDNAGQTFNATRNTQKNAEKAALNKCVNAGGNGCAIKTCVKAALGDTDESSAPQLGCQLNAITFANQDFQTLQQARNECNRLLQLVGDTNTQDCRAVTVQDQDGNIFRRAELRVQNQVQGLTLQQALQQLTLLVLNNGLLGDPALQIQVATQGSCAQ